jgi:hypothetical protein
MKPKTNTKQDIDHLEKRIEIIVDQFEHRTALKVGVIKINHDADLNGAAQVKVEVS